MKKFLSILAVVVTVGLSAIAMPDADAARRMGGGKSVGMQRQAAPNKPAAAPAQNTTTPAGAATPSRSWMGPLAGIAAGLGLAALASHFGFGGELASMMLMALVAVAAIAAVGFFMRRRASQQAPMAAGINGKSYPFPGGQSADTATPAYRVEHPASSGSMIGAQLGGASSAASIPADFDTVAFERNAKVSFIRLQAANDKGDLDDIRSFTTPQMFAEIKTDIDERGKAAQQFEVGSVTAKVLTVETTSDAYVVSVRFTGFMRDSIGGEIGRASCRERVSSPV